MNNKEEDNQENINELEKGKEKKDSLMLSIYDHISTKNRLSFAMISDNIYDLMTTAAKENININLCITKDKDKMLLVGGSDKDKAENEEICITSLVCVMIYMMDHISDAKDDIESQKEYILSVLTKVFIKCMQLN